MQSQHLCSIAHAISLCFCRICSLVTVVVTLIHVYSWSDEVMAVAKHVRSTLIIMELWLIEVKGKIDVLLRKI